MASSDAPPREFALSSFGRGALMALEGARFIRRERSLWGLALVPMFFALLGLAGATFLFGSFLGTIHELWAGLLPTLEASAWWHWIWVGPSRALFWLLGWLGVLVSFAVALVAGLIFAQVLSAPFLDRLSQRVECIESSATASTATPPQSAGLLRDSLGSFAAELQRLLFLALAWIVISGLGLVVPGGQVVAGPALIALTIFFLPLDYAGFALDRRGLGFADRRRWLLRHRSLMLGFGSVSFVACLVPGLNLLILPIQVTAGTLLVARRQPASG